MEKFTNGERKLIIIISIFFIFIVLLENLYHSYQVEKSLKVRECGNIISIFYKQNDTSTRVYPLRYVVLQKDNQQEKTFLIPQHIYIEQQNFKVQQTSLHLELKIKDNICVTYSTEYPYSNTSIYEKEFPAIIHVELLN